MFLAKKISTAVCVVSDTASGVYISTEVARGRQIAACVKRLQALKNKGTKKMLEDFSTREERLLFLVCTQHARGSWTEGSSGYFV